MTEYKEISAYDGLDIYKLQDFAKKGWYFHKKKINSVILEKGQPGDYIYQRVYDKKITPEVKKYYEEAGWIVKKCTYQYHLARGTKESLPIFTEDETLEEMLKYRIRKSLLVAALGVLLVIISAYFDLWNKGSFIVKLICQMLAAPIGFGLAGVVYYRQRLYRYRNNIKDDD